MKINGVTVNHTLYVVASGKGKSRITKSGKACIYQEIVPEDVNGLDNIENYKQQWQNYDYTYYTRRIFHGGKRSILFKVFKQL